MLQKPGPEDGDWKWWQGETVRGTGESSLRSWAFGVGLPEKVSFASCPEGSEGFSPCK